MLAPQPQKLLIVNILDILKRYTDEEHRLSQKEIEMLLKTEYGMKAGRKAVKRNLMDLLEFGYEIEYTEITRRVKNAKTGEWEESTILTDFYLVHDFTDGELRLLIDGLLFSKHIPYSQCRQLVEKLEGLSTRYFRAKVGHIRTLPDTAPENRQLFLTIETLDEAISRGRQVAFHYLAYGTDKKAHPRKNSAGIHCQSLSDGGGERPVLPHRKLRQIRGCGPLPSGPHRGHPGAGYAGKARPQGQGAGKRVSSAAAHGGARVHVHR